MCISRAPSSSFTRLASVPPGGGGGAFPHRYDNTTSLKHRMCLRGHVGTLPLTTNLKRLHSSSRFFFPGDDTFLTRGRCLRADWPRRIFSVWPVSHKPPPAPRGELTTEQTEISEPPPPPPPGRPPDTQQHIIIQLVAY